MTRNIQRRYEIRRVITLFEDFKGKIKAVAGPSSLESFVEIPQNAVTIDQDGVNVNLDHSLRFSDYLDLLRNTEVKRISEGHPAKVNSPLDIAINLETEYGHFLALMSRYNQDYDWVAVSYRARNILRNLIKQHPTILH